MRLQRLNMDNSWALNVGGVEVLVDPWLEGVEVDYFSWFNTQWHRTAPLAYDALPAYDHVLITQKYADHFHAMTLERLNPASVIAPKSLGTKLTSPAEGNAPPSRWGGRHHRGQWYKGASLPTRRRIDPIYDAFILDDGDEYAFVAPHGFSLDAKHKTCLEHHSRCTVLFSPFNRYALPTALGGIVSPGLEPLRHLSETLRPAHIVQTHDEDKHASGIVNRFARITRFHETQLEQHPWLQAKLLSLSNYQPVNV